MGEPFSGAGLCAVLARSRIEQDGKLVAQTQFPIPVFLEDYFFFLPPVFAFFFAAMDITSNQFLNSSHLMHLIWTQMFDRPAVHCSK